MGVASLSDLFLFDLIVNYNRHRFATGKQIDYMNIVKFNMKIKKFTKTLPITPLINDHVAMTTVK